MAYALNINYTYLRSKVESIMLILLLIITSTLSPAAFGNCSAENNKPLQKMKALLQSSASASQKSQKIANSIDIALFAKRAVPAKMASQLTAENRVQVELFLRHAIQTNLYSFLSHQWLSRYRFNKTACTGSSKQVLIGEKKNSATGIYFPIILSYQKSSQWKLVNINIYATFLNTAYAYQFNNWLGKESLNQIMVAIKKQNAILESKSTSAS